MKLVGQLREITLHQRLHVGVRRGGVSSLVFADFRGSLGTERYRQIRILGLQDGQCRTFMFVVSVGMQERDGDRFDPLANELIDNGTELPLVQRAQHGAGCVHTFVDLPPQTARHEGFH